MKNKCRRKKSYSSSSDDDYVDYEFGRNKKECVKGDEVLVERKIRATEIIATGCLVVQTEQADPDWIRGPIAIVSTTTGSTNLSLMGTNQNQTIGNVNTVVIANVFEPSPALPFPVGTQIPQGVFVSNNSNVFQGSRLPNYVNIMETRNAATICTWKCAREIYSKFYIQNISNFTTYNVGFVLIAYSNNTILEVASILDQDVKTLRPGEYGTFRVNWKRYDSALPFQNDAVQVIIQTSVLLVNQLFTQQALSDLVTFKFVYPSLQPKIVLLY